MRCTSISGLVVEYIVAIDVTQVRFPADAEMWRELVSLGKLEASTCKTQENVPQVIVLHIAYGPDVCSPVA